ncbi:MAG: fibronectin type III-like domain-contianing protein [Chitinophagaceae bacterium]|nr:fibronectin type III-like domain-contianing protein [Chitinophagaceae bacterium]
MIRDYSDVWYTREGNHEQHKTRFFRHERTRRSHPCDLATCGLGIGAGSKCTASNNSRPAACGRPAAPDDARRKGHAVILDVPDGADRHRRPAPRLTRHESEARDRADLGAGRVRAQVARDIGEDDQCDPALSAHGDPAQPTPGARREALHLRQRDPIREAPGRHHPRPSAPALGDDERAPGETRTVNLVVPAKDFAYYDSVKGWIVEPGSYEVIVGRHSEDEGALKANFTCQPESAKRK